ncbi:Arc family DNA-binding protein [Variovorax sp. JS1663]|uniref:Arc family DNA-binding protein n=1 Tax=Variovorax sp. JS1663 TaxID=1851577 RepID=UPI000B341139|nr:Arc family DNA-binding protein [Variovorax sp. JS1663]OUM01781.1 hypothetical protein A8M77_14565 [Variovorax sp. JS1663]
MQAGDKYIVRFPEGMRERIAEVAKANNRSMNAEIVARLESSFDLPTGYVTQEQFENALRNAVLNFEADQFVMGTVRTMLASNVVRLFELVPEDRRTEALANAYEFARALKAPGSVGLEEAASKIMRRAADDKESKDLASALRRQEGRLQQQLDADRVADVKLGRKEPKL